MRLRIHFKSLYLVASEVIHFDFYYSLDLCTPLLSSLCLTQSLILKVCKCVRVCAGVCLDKFVVQVSFSQYAIDHVLELSHHWNTHTVARTLAHMIHCVSIIHTIEFPCLINKIENLFSISDQKQHSYGHTLIHTNTFDGIISNAFGFYWTKSVFHSIVSLTAKILRFVFIRSFIYMLKIELNESRIKGMLSPKRQ